MARLRRGRRVAAMRRDFDPAWYISMYPDVANEHREPFDHYLASGWAEDRAPNMRIWRLRMGACEAFDPAWYLRKYPDVAKRDRDPLDHYLSDGRREGRFPNLAGARAAAWVRTFGDR